ncbi:ABC transporter ATP-binding protein [Pedobacter yonginense]|uniref:ABC transporter ATP-binding protein n=1 Tax=Pedobacter yonginense TaxID=651869 RepID=A0A317ELE4_9SPHI|nr:peptidase domain-containing ABC transporter [Pedobacter yonginense]PWS26106.1 ABC transporter ATP-binding protein [Pedobacter yonginense]
MSLSFPNYKQKDKKDCGATCLKIILKYYKISYSSHLLNEMCETTREGTTFFHLSEAAEKIGFRTAGLELKFDQLKDEVNLPCICHWNRHHFIVVYKITNKKVYTSDPAHGLINYSKEDFLDGWKRYISIKKEVVGNVLLCEPTPELGSSINEYHQPTKLSLTYYFKHALFNKKLLYQIGLSLLITAILGLISPLISKNMVDIGILNKDIKFIYILLIFQVVLFLISSIIEMFRSWMLLYLGSSLSINILSSFFIKLMSLPISYFENRMKGDILQRIRDNSRIQSLISTTPISILLATFNFIVFSIILILYNYKIFFINIIGTLIYIGWVVIFLKKRKDLDYKNFNRSKEEQSSLIDIVTGMQEIKLFNAERKKRWKWERLQAKLFTIRRESLYYDQIQVTGSNLINQIKNISLSVTSATLVVKGEMTLGMMMAVTYMLAQVNSPLMQYVSLIRMLQESKISIDRLSEVHDKESEDNGSPTIIEARADIKLSNISFRYVGGEENVLENVTLTIPNGKVTAIVGESGGGKTTLLKLILGYYTPQKGKIFIGDINLSDLSIRSWRKICGAVMQNGYLFNDSVENNIAMSDDLPNKEKLKKAASAANILDFINKMPNKFKTNIGMDGVGISGGQQQRILIARALYDLPSYLFLDEATSSLDANNESEISGNLRNIFNGKTVLVIAHRLSTIKNADQIVVMSKGKILEVGTHHELLGLKGNYCQLISNQIGNA